MRRWAAVVGTAALAVALLVRPGPAPAQQALRIGYPVWVGYGPLFLADRKGMLADLGVNVDFVLMEDTKTRYVALAAGKIDGLMTTIDTVVLRVRPDFQVAAVMAFDDSKGGDGIVARREIRTVRDLKGKTVAFGEGSVSHFFLGFLLQRNGLTFRDIVPVNMTAGDAGAAFVAGKVDAAVTWEPWLTRGKQAPHGHLLVDSSATPGLIVDVLVFRKDVLRRREVEVRNVVRAWHRAVEYWKTHPQESNRIMAQAVGGWLKDPQVFAETLTGIRYYDYELNRAFFAPGGGIYKTAQFAIDFWAAQGKVQVPGLRARDIVDGSFIAR
ncbi:MAG: ABC transporter substrate-binding protein [Armatimonadota bacterium]|nr:ABC transporter substrate-binding protein [Armatimonadota bacterium]MDR7402013.1 ABC transporter substrate-binding protein [Armatimonadota bacterium]MDR7437966.1 ABC transporter substrate-binding protein [Armatimonadota bacterium]MDR7473092.1 ABC transporter substrate-binding protein [Armatimonadota bacterium]MDR7507420.1 ABC transporter substrate-binding protein [Armatimonadota bacterium]